MMDDDRDLLDPALVDGDVDDADAEEDASGAEEPAEKEAW